MSFEASFRATNEPTVPMGRRAKSTGPLRDPWEISTRPVKATDAGCSRGSYGTIALIPRSRSVPKGDGSRFVCEQTRRFISEQRAERRGALTAMARVSPSFLSRARTLPERTRSRLRPR